MALIKCSECGKDVSDKASSCPNCGAPILENAKAVVDEPRREPLGPVIKENGKAIMFISIGVIMVIVGLMTIVMIIGIIPLLLGVAFISFGRNQLAGTRHSRCPKCGAKIEVKANESVIQCNACKGALRIRGQYLEEVR